jgi:phage shock protein C
MEKKLLRNEHDKVIAGVSSGLADYMQVDVTIIRLLFVLSTIFLVGTGILVYLVMWIVVPVNNDPAQRFTKFNDYFKGQDPFSMPFQAPEPPKPAEGTAAKNEESNSWTDWTSSSMKGGFGNPVDYGQPFTKEFGNAPKSNDNSTGRTIGGLFLLVIGLYFLLNEFDIIPFWFSLHKLWPLVFVAIGLSFILKSKRRNDFENWKKTQDTGTDTSDQNI